ncbi:thermostable hemolysin [Erwinia sp. AnSW2-5]|uniref:thermostable hemolysin n=1 Tax=Erwinia sp. AnSW2-5 TaxID=3367692 RepID=UPI003859EB40
MIIQSPYSLKWCTGSEENNATAHFIREKYRETYHAHLAECMPWLLSLQDAQGKQNAACGIRLASAGPLYLEQYLDRPADVLISMHFSGEIPRHTIVEVGNFAASDGASARVMYAAVCLLLNRYHFTHIVFTGTHKIRNIFSRLRLNPVLLTDARPERLADNPQQWGSYYQYQPQVMAGELARGMAALSQNSLLFNLFKVLPACPWSTPGSSVCL